MKLILNLLNYLKKKKVFLIVRIYEGESTSYEVINLKPNQTYCFKLKINKTNSTIKKEISVKTLISPHAILSEKSVEIANGKQFDNVKKVILDFQKKFIKNCIRRRN